MTGSNKTLRAVAVVAAVAAVVATLAAFGAARWRARTRALIAELDAACQPLTPARYDAARELAGLPAPVQRFFRAVLRDGQPLVAAVEIAHRGSFNLAADGADRWRPFTSTQHIATRRPGFVWDGRIGVAPGVAVHVHDAYVAGEGLLRPAVAGLWPLADLHGADAEPGGVAHGEFLRYLAETAWYPTALLPSQGARWTAVDDDSATVTLRDGALTATMRFAFDPVSGLVVSARADARGRTLGGDTVPTPWEGRWADHTERRGMQVPLRGEVAWLTPHGRRPYWRGTVTALRYRFAEP